MGVPATRAQVTACGALDLGISIWRPNWPTRQIRARTIEGDRSHGKGKGGHQMAGKFELYKDAGGKFRFRLKAGNGEIIASSEAYNAKASALSGIESVKTNAANAAIDDQT